MKKIVLIIMVALISFGANAQNINIQSATNEVKLGNFVKAKQYIDKATADGSSTATSAKAWLVKGAIYQAIGRSVDKDKSGKAAPFTMYVNGVERVFDITKANMLQVETPNALEEALNAYKKVIKYSKRVDNDELQPLAYDLYTQVFNAGVTNYKSKKYAEAMKSFGLVKEVRALNEGKLLKPDNLEGRMTAVKKNIGIISDQSSLYNTYSAYYIGDDKLTLAAAEESIASGSANDQVYVMAAEMYKKKGNTDKYASALAEGMKKFPDSKPLRNEQINAAIKSGNQMEAVKKLEAALVKDPGNAELQFNTGVIYAEMGSKSNDPSIMAKAEAAYKAAIKLDGTNPDYIFNLGALYFNQAKTATDIMNKEKDDNKYQVMKKDRDAIMAKSLPLLEQAKSTLETNKNFKTESYQKTYKDALTALNMAYIILGKSDKANEIAPLLKGLK